MRNWALVAGVTAAVAATTAIVVWRYRHNQAQQLPDVSDVIEDCFDRIRQIEADLGKLTPAAERVH